MRPFFLPVLLLLPLAAHGTLVTTHLDEDDGHLGGGSGISLREAVKYSAAETTITFAPELSGQTIRLILGRITIANSLTIDGSGLASQITLSGDKTGNGRTADDTYVLQIETGITVALDSLTISGGLGSRGGGMRIIGASNQNRPIVTVSRCLFAGNSSFGDGGGAIHSEGNLTVRSSTFTGNVGLVGGGVLVLFGTGLFEDSVFTANSATQQGSSVSQTTPSGGAIFAGSGFVTLLNSTVSGNSATYGGGIDSATSLVLQNSSIVGNSATSGGGIFVRNGAMEATDSDISANTASLSGAGILNSSGVVILLNSSLADNHAENAGGGIFQFLGSMILKNSTLTRNHAKAAGGAIYVNTDGLDVQNSTVSGNIAHTSRGGGIASHNGTLTFHNSVIAGNFAPNAPDEQDVSGTFTGSHNLTSGAPHLAPLGDYGGPTQTMPPLPGSPAIDVGGATTLTTDQRGFPRVSTPDIGAAEYQETADLVRFWNLDFDGDGSPYGVEHALGTDPLVSDADSPRNLRPPLFDFVRHPRLQIGLNSEAVTETWWVLSRSPNLNPGSFEEIYRFDGRTGIAAPGITFTVAPGRRITVTDENPPPGGAFYRFEAVLEP